MSSTLQEGAVFADRYRILRRIAAGGMGAVYEVLHLETERRRALKVMLPHVLQSDDLRARFKREAKVAAQIESDFIVDVFDAGVDDATQMPFLVMELLRGEELGKRLKRLGRLPPIEVATWLQQTAVALDKTHRASIVHRDLKPENLFLAERDDGPPRIKVLDFGVAKIVAESATAGATQSIGTPIYMAPEQFNPRITLTAAADIFAFGMVAYTLLVGSPYWAEEARGGNIFALATVAMRGPDEPASVRAALRGVALPPAFDAWFARVTAADPARRFPTASEAARALTEALGLPSVSGIYPSALESSSAIVPAPVSAPAAAVPATPLQSTGQGLTATAPLPRRSTSRAVLVALVCLGAAAALALTSYVVMSSRAAPAVASALPPGDIQPAAPAAPLPPPPTAPQVAPAPTASASALLPQPTAEAPSTSAATLPVSKAKPKPAGPPPKKSAYSQD
jgi:eukaryotic-like serine/threonine-protein kinase